MIPLWGLVLLILMCWCAGAVVYVLTGAFYHRRRWSRRWWM